MWNILKLMTANGTDGLTTIRRMRFGICAMDLPEHQNLLCRAESARTALADSDAICLLRWYCSHNFLSWNGNCIALYLPLSVLLLGTQTLARRDADQCQDISIGGVLEREILEMKQIT
jgi:hypothetical protein